MLEMYTVALSPVTISVLLPAGLRGRRRRGQAREIVIQCQAIDQPGTQDSHRLLVGVQSGGDA